MRRSESHGARRLSAGTACASSPARFWSVACPLTESEFLALADAELGRIERTVERAADEADADIEIGRVGNVLTLEFDDGSKIIINSQAPMQELWVAARAGGFHFRRNDGRWVDTRSGEELYVALSRYVSQQSDVDVTLVAD
ncbi:iron donor protein CyaY [Ralstonia syzygii subsp. celebesensis]|uniref:iron donor protein CyaY n=1 Tax=Ralstonia syzygii TaxID=28097 RepID=UPI00387E12C3